MKLIQQAFKVNVELWEIAHGSYAAHFVPVRTIIHTSCVCFCKLTVCRKTLTSRQLAEMMPPSQGIVWPLI